MAALVRSGTETKANEARSSPLTVELRRGTGAPTYAGRSPARIVEAFDRQRQMLERDLHDGVQQRLVALRIRLALAAELAGGDALLHETLDDIGESVDAAI